MRYLLLLFLSFPAYGAVIDVNLPITWEVHAALPLNHPAFPGGDLVGSFTTDQDRITQWDFEPIPFYHWPSSDAICPSSPSSNCNQATFISPTHLHFNYFGTYSSRASLELFLSAPLGGQSVTLTGADYTYFNGGDQTVHYDAGTVTSGVAAAIPEPHSLLFLALALAIRLGIPKRR